MIICNESVELGSWLSPKILQKKTLFITHFHFVAPSIGSPKIQCVRALGRVTVPAPIAFAGGPAGSADLQMMAMFQSFSHLNLTPSPAETKKLIGENTQMSKQRVWCEIQIVSDLNMRELQEKMVTRPVKLFPGLWMWLVPLPVEHWAGV